MFNKLCVDFVSLACDLCCRLSDLVALYPQAREDVIHMLKTEKTKPEVLEAHYGSAEPEKVLRVLHRDAILAQEKSIGEDVYEKPISEVKIQHQQVPL